MKNKKGWGFIEFIIFLLIFAICLLIAATGLKKLGLLDENFHIYNPNESSSNSSNTNKGKDNETTKPKETDYKSLEESAVNATKKYIEDFYNNELGLDTLNIRVSQLVDNKYMNELEDVKKRKCSGYVSVYLDSEDVIKYDPYIKCKEYTTKGYEERKDD